MDFLQKVHVWDRDPGWVRSMGPLGEDRLGAAFAPIGRQPIQPQASCQILSIRKCVTVSGVGAFNQGQCPRFGVGRIPPVRWRS